MHAPPLAAQAGLAGPEQRARAARERPQALRPGAGQPGAVPQGPLLPGSSAARGSGRFPPAVSGKDARVCPAPRPERASVAPAGGSPASWLAAKRGLGPECPGGARGGLFGSGLALTAGEPRPCLALDPPQRGWRLGASDRETFRGAGQPAGAGVLGCRVALPSARQAGSPANEARGEEKKRELSGPYSSLVRSQEPLRVTNY